MENEWNLSDEIQNHSRGIGDPELYLEIEDVREFIKKLKDKCFGYAVDSQVTDIDSKPRPRTIFDDIIDKLAGDKLK